MCETCLKLARSDIFIDDLEHVSYTDLMFPLLTLQKKKKMPARAIIKNSS